MYGEAHHIIKRAIDAGDGGISYPFLDPVSARLVVGAVFVQVVIYFVVRQLAEVHQGGVGDGFAAGDIPDRDRGDDLVGSPGKGAEHLHGIFPAVRLAHDIAVQQHHGVGGDKDFVRLQRTVKAPGFALGHERWHLGMGCVRAEALFETVPGVDRKIYVQACEQLAPAGRSARQYDLLAL